MMWVFDNFDRVLHLLLMHLQLVVPAIVATLLISVSVAYGVTKLPRIREWVLTASGLLYSIPSLPLLIVLPLILGIPLRSNLNVQVALTIYGCSLLIRAAADAFDQVDSKVLQASLACGMSPLQCFWKVHLPLAGPAILAGLRVVAVSTIALTTIGALLGISSLGSLFTDGLMRSIVAEVITGIVATVLLAVSVDFLLVLLGRLVMPFQKVMRSKQKQNAKLVMQV
ncbi:ABC transporter, permease protein [Gleimia coleocanis DSM 15436]|uniref:ABC transporter, permease protein n=1 Tax=Gleimia coleocanis DSM 15436 TaxID=525245 RepID=C0VZ64_9ACTO|nr:ABC transporter permease subunit [Gleimia coleocanis]EEH64717.1 ABC transporter, permease protein [Gleimia coleocanis DSM 15436]